MISSLHVRSENVRLSLCFFWVPRHEWVLGEWRYSSTYSLTSAVDRDEWSASLSGRVTPRERAPVTHCIGCSVGPSSYQNFVCIFYHSHVCYMLCPSHPLWFDHPNNIWWSVQVMKLLIMQCSPASHHFLLGPNILLSILFSNPQSVFFAWCEGSCSRK
jgi:hypothetical protein